MDRTDGWGVIVGRRKQSGIAPPWSLFRGRGRHRIGSAFRNAAAIPDSGITPRAAYPRRNGEHSDEAKGWQHENQLSHAILARFATAETDWELNQPIAPAVLRAGKNSR